MKYRYVVLICRTIVMCVMIAGVCYCTAEIDKSPPQCTLQLK